jgi:hypothetical protein
MLLCGHDHARLASRCKQSLSIEGFDGRYVHDFRSNTVGSQHFASLKGY